MRSASTQEKTDLILRKLKSSNCKGKVQVQYDNNGTWTTLNDIDEGKGINWNKSSKKYKYASFSLTPACSDISFTILNKNGKYSEGSGDSLAGIIDLDTKIRLKAGYELPGISGSTDETLTLNGAEAFYFYTQYSGGKIILDEAGTYNGADIYFQDLFGTYGDVKYSDLPGYTATGYYLITRDFEGDDYVNINTITVNCNNTSGTIYWRVFNDRATFEATHKTSDTWENAGATVNGDKEIIIDKDERYIQIAILYDGVTWDSGVEINSIAINYLTKIEWVYYNVFYLDTPEYTDPPAGNFPLINCKGRDIWKRVVETNLNLPDLSGGVYLDDLVKDICDKIGVGYTTASIADLTSFGQRTLAAGLSNADNKEPPKVLDIFENVMQVINQGTGTKYQMYIEYDSGEDDNILFLQPKPSTYEANFVMNYFHYTSMGNKRKNYDKLLKTMTVLTDTQVVDEEVQLGQATYTTTGQKTISWSGDAEYKRYTVESLSGDLSTVTLNAVNTTSMVFDITGATVNVRITVYGNKWSSTAPTFEGEFINNSNMVNNIGITSKIENRMILSDAEAALIAKGFITDFGSPVWETNNIKWPYMNLLPEINDPNLIWSRWTYTDDIYAITGIKHHWDDKSDNTIFNLEDTGLNFSDVSDFIYDDIMDYDTGYLYDMVHGVGATQAEAEAAYNVIHNNTFS